MSKKNRRFDRTTERRAFKHMGLRDVDDPDPLHVVATPTGELMRFNGPVGCIHATAPVIEFMDADTVKELIMRRRQV